MQAHSRRWLLIALLYFVVGASLGVYMGASHDHSLMPVHAHINLLGWVSLTLTGVVYHFFPAAGTSKLATVHFWLYNLAVPALLVFLAMLLSGNAGVEPVVGILSVLVLLAILLFAFNVYTHRD